MATKAAQEVKFGFWIAAGFWLFAGVLAIMTLIVVRSFNQ